MYLCSSCKRTFHHFKSPGQCPRCGIHAQVRCSGCSYTDSSTVFTKNGDVCPKCGAQVAVPGSGGDPVPLNPKARLAGLLVALGGLVVVLPMVVVFSQRHDASSRVSQVRPTAPVAQKTMPAVPDIRFVDQTTGPEWPRKLLARDYGAEMFVPPEQLSKVTALWNRAFSKYKHNSSNQELYDAVLEVLKGRRFYPNLTTDQSLNYLIDEGIPPSVAHHSDRPANLVAENILGQIKEQYDRQLEEDIAYQQEVAEGLEENRASALERGQARNRATADRMEAQRAQQSELQQRVRDQAVEDQERLRLYPQTRGPLR